MHTSKHLLSRLALNRFESLTDIQVRHWKIPTSVLQGPFLTSVAKFVWWGCRNAITTNFRCNLRHKATQSECINYFFFYVNVLIVVHDRLSVHADCGLTLLSGSWPGKKKKEREFIRYNSYLILTISIVSGYNIKPHILLSTSISTSS